MLDGAGCSKKSKSNRDRNQPAHAEQQRACSAEQRQGPSIEQQQEPTTERQQESSTEQRPLLEATFLEDLPYSQVVQLEYFFQCYLAQLIGKDDPAEPEIVDDTEDNLPGVGTLTSNTGPFALAPGQPRPSIYSFSVENVEPSKIDSLVANLSVTSATTSQAPSTTTQSKSQLLPQYHPRLFTGIRNFSRILQAKITHSEAFGRVRTSSTINTNIDHKQLNIVGEVKKHEKLTSYTLFDQVYEIKTPDKVDFGHRPNIDMTFLVRCPIHKNQMPLCGCLVRELGMPVKRHLDKILSQQHSGDEAEDSAFPAQNEARVPMLGLPSHHQERAPDKSSDKESEYSSSAKPTLLLGAASTSKQAESIVSPGKRSKKSPAKPKLRKSKLQDFEISTSKKREETISSKEGSRKSEKPVENCALEIEVCQASTSKKVESTISPKKLRTSSPTKSKVHGIQLQVGKSSARNQAQANNKIKSTITSGQPFTTSPATSQNRAPQLQVFESSTSQEAEISKTYGEQSISSTAIYKEHTLQLQLGETSSTKRRESEIPPGKPTKTSPATLEARAPKLQPSEGSTSKKAESTITSKRESRIPKPKFTLSPRQERTISAVRSKYCPPQLTADTSKKAESTIPPGEQLGISSIEKSGKSQARPLHLGQTSTSKKSEITILPQKLTSTSKSKEHTAKIQICEPSTSKQAESPEPPGEPSTYFPTKSKTPHSQVGKESSSMETEISVSQENQGTTSEKSQDRVLQIKAAETSTSTRSTISSGESGTFSLIKSKAHVSEGQVNVTSTTKQVDRTSKKTKSPLSPGKLSTTAPLKSGEHVPQMQISQPSTSMQSASVIAPEQLSTSIPEKNIAISSKLEINEASTSKKAESIISVEKHRTYPPLKSEKLAPEHDVFEADTSQPEEDSAIEFEFLNNVKFEDLLRMVSLEKNKNHKDDAGESSQQSAPADADELPRGEMENYREVTLFDLTQEQQEMLEKKAWDVHRLWSRLGGSDCPPPRRNLGFNPDRVLRPRLRSEDEILRLFGVLSFIVMDDHCIQMTRMMTLIPKCKKIYSDLSPKNHSIRLLVQGHRHILANNLIYLSHQLDFAKSERSLYIYEALRDDVSDNKICLSLTQKYVKIILDEGNNFQFRALNTFVEDYDKIREETEALKNRGAQDFSKITDATLKFLNLKLNYVGHLQDQRRIGQNMHNLPEQNPLVEPAQDQPPQNAPQGLDEPSERPLVQLLQPTEQPCPSIPRSTVASHERRPVQPDRPVGQPGPSTSTSTAAEPAESTQADRRVGMGLSKKAQKRSRKKAREAQTTTSKERADDSVEQKPDTPTVKQTESSASTSRMGTKTEEGQEVVREIEIAASILPSAQSQSAANQYVAAPAPRAESRFIMRRVGSLPYRRDVDPSWPIELPVHRLRSSRFKVKLRDILMGNDPNFEIKLFKKTSNPDDDDDDDWD